MVPMSDVCFEHEFQDLEREEPVFIESECWQTRWLKNMQRANVCESFWKKRCGRTDVSCHHR